MSDTFQPIEASDVAARDDDVPLLTPIEGYTISTAAAATFFSPCDDELSRIDDSVVHFARSTEGRPPPLLDIDIHIVDNDESDDESLRTPAPKLKMLSSHRTLQQMQPFSGLMK